MHELTISISGRIPSKRTGEEIHRIGIRRNERRILAWHKERTVCYAIVENSTIRPTNPLRPAALRYAACHVAVPKIGRFEASRSAGVFANATCDLPGETVERRYRSLPLCLAALSTPPNFAVFMPMTLAYTVTALLITQLNCAAWGDYRSPMRECD